MLPKKRTQIDQFDREYSATPNDLINNYFPELNDRSKRSIYFQDYEFPEKQTLVKNYWDGALQRFFEHNFDGCVVEWRRIQAQFEVKNSFPLGLEKIMLKLWDEKRIILLKDKNEKEVILPHLSNFVLPIKKVGTMESIARFFKKPIKCFTSETIVIYLPFFKELYHSIEKKIIEVFKIGEVLLEDDFLSTFDEVFRCLKFSERPLILFVLFSLEVISKIEKDKQVFVCYKKKRLSETELERQISEKSLEKKIGGLEITLNGLKARIKELIIKATQEKKIGDRKQCEKTLAEKMTLDLRVNKFESVKLMLIKTLHNLQNSKDDSETANIISQTNRLLKNNEFDLEHFMENVQIVAEQSQKNEEFVDFVNKGVGLNDNEEEYELLNDELLNQNQEISKLIRPDRNIRNKDSEDFKKVQKEEEKRSNDEHEKFMKNLLG